MLGAAEFTGPTSYAAWLTWLAVLLPVLVVAWYAGVTWWARSPRRLGGAGLEARRREHLERLDRVEAEVAAGDLSLRAAHQAISEIVRSYASVAGPVDALPMTLEQLRVHGRTGLVDVVALVTRRSSRLGSRASPPTGWHPRSRTPGSSSGSGSVNDLRWPLLAIGLTVVALVLLLLWTRRPRRGASGMPVAHVPFAVAVAGFVVLLGGALLGRRR